MRQKCKLHVYGLFDFTLFCFYQKATLFSPLLYYRWHRTLCKLYACWFHTLTYCKMRTALRLATDTSNISQNYHFFLWWEHLRSTLKGVILEAFNTYEHIFKSYWKLCTFLYGERERHLTSRFGCQVRLWFCCPAHATQLVGNCTRSLRISCILGDSLVAPCMHGTEILRGAQPKPVDNTNMGKPITWRILRIFVSPNSLGFSVMTK